MQKDHECSDLDLHPLNSGKRIGRMYQQKLITESRGSTIFGQIAKSREKSAGQQENRLA
jgi:hypothetical protein